MAPPPGLMKLLVAPESNMASWSTFCLRILLGSLISFLSCNSFLNLLLHVVGWCVFPCCIVSPVKLARGSNSSHVGSFDVSFVGSWLMPQFGGRGKLQLDSMLLPPPPQVLPPSETWQDSCAAYSLLSTAVCCCLLCGDDWEGIGFAWSPASSNLCSRASKMHLDISFWVSKSCNLLLILLAFLLSHLEVREGGLALSTLTRRLLSLKLEASGDLTTTSLALVFAERFPDKGFGFSSIPLSKAGCGTWPQASLVSQLSPWPVDCGRVPRFPLGLGALVSGVSWAQCFKLFHNFSNSAPISPLLLNTYSFWFAAPLMVALGLSFGEGEVNILAGVLVLGGWGSCCGCFPKISGFGGPFLDLCWLAKGSGGSALVGGHISVLARCRGGSGGSRWHRGPLSVAKHRREGSGGSRRCWEPLSVAKHRRGGSGGSRWRWEPLSVANHRRIRSVGSASVLGTTFVYCIDAPGGPGHACVVSRFAGNLCWGTGRSSCSLLLCGGVQWDLCWGAGLISIPLIRFRIFLPGSPKTE